jgi:hypothetical protein
MPFGILLGLFGQGSSASAWQINEVVLPYGPLKFGLTGDANEDSITQSGEEPIIIIDGLTGTVLTLSGTITADSKTVDQLWSEIISPLLDLRGGEVMLVCPISALNGVWTLVGFQPSSGKHSIYEYTMRLKKSSLTVVLNSNEENPV